MDNAEIEFDLGKLSEESKTNTKTFLSRKHLLSKDINLDEFEDGLNVSDIEDNSKNGKNYDDSFNDFSEDLNDFDEREHISKERKISMDSIDIDFSYKANKKKKIEKDDLNNIPLPIFDCIYCTNEKIVFNNFINNILSEKYLLLSSVYDIKDLDEIIENNNLINKKIKNTKILNLMVKNIEYLNNYIPKEESKLFFKSNWFNNLCMKRDFQKINNINKKNSINSRFYLIGNTDIYSSNDNNFKNKYNNNSYSNNSINLNSLSLNKNESDINYINDKNNNFEYIFENIITKDNNTSLIEKKDEIIEDRDRVIRKEDIAWDEKYYDIYNPDISSDFEESISIEKDNCDFENNIKIKKAKLIKRSDSQINNIPKRYNIFNEKNNFFCVNDKYNKKQFKNKNILNINCFKNINNINNNCRFNYINNNFFQDMNINRCRIYNNNNNNSILNEKYDHQYFKEINSYLYNKYINKIFFFNDNIFKSTNKKAKNIKSIRMTILQNNTNNNSTNYSIDTSNDSELMKDKPLKSNNIKRKKDCYFTYLEDKHIIYYKHTKPKTSIEQKKFKKDKTFTYFNNMKYKYFNKNKINLNMIFNNNYQRNIYNKKKGILFNKNKNFIFHSKEKNQRAYNLSYNKNKKMNFNISFSSYSSFIINKNTFKQNNISYGNVSNKHLNSNIDINNKIFLINKKNSIIYNHFLQNKYKTTYNLLEKTIQMNYI